MATKWQNIQYQLDAWCKEYSIDPSKVIFQGWENMDEGGKFVFGRYNGYYAGYATVKLSKRFEKHKLGFLELSVLWHEYCHAEAFLEDMKCNGHDEVWKAKKNRKMKYVIGDALVWLVYPFL